MRIGRCAFLKTVRFAFVVVVCAGGRASLGGGAWPQWGGSNRDFTVSSTAPLNWPEGGFKELWRRPLGQGYSGIVCDSGRCYTMVRRGEQEVVVALSMADGKTVWEHAYDSPYFDGANPEYGGGPNSTPLLSDGRLVTVGFNGVAKCLEAQSGKVVWTVNLFKDLQSTKLEFGYANSPLIYGGMVIFPVGGEKTAFVALRLKDGSKAWAAQNFANTYSTPDIIEVDGQDQFVVAMAEHVVGIDPKQGELLWTFPFKNEWDTHVVDPVWGKDHILFVGSFGEAKGLRLKRAEGKTLVEEVWSSKKADITHCNAVRIGDVVYSTVGESPAFVAALDVKTGELLWKERGFGLANYLALGDRLLVIDERGQLALCRPDRNGLNVLGKSKLFDIAEAAPSDGTSDGVQDGPPVPPVGGKSVGNRVWTAPTLVGDILFARDQKEIVAVKLR